MRVIFQAHLEASCLILSWLPEKYQVVRNLTFVCMWPITLQHQQTDDVHLIYIKNAIKMTSVEHTHARPNNVYLHL